MSKWKAIASTIQSISEMLEKELFGITWRKLPISYNWPFKPLISKMKYKMAFSRI